MADCRLTNGQQSTDDQPTDHRLTANSWWTNGRLTTNQQPVVSRHVSVDHKVYLYPQQWHLAQQEGVPTMLAFVAC